MSQSQRSDSHYQKLGSCPAAGGAAAMPDPRGAATMFLMVGLPAAGKTTRARELAATYQAVRLTPDHWHIALLGNSIGDFQRPGGERWVLEGRLISVALQVLRLG